MNRFISIAAIFNIAFVGSASAQMEQIPQLSAQCTDEIEEKGSFSPRTLGFVLATSYERDLTALFAPDGQSARDVLPPDIENAIIIDGQSVTILRYSVNGELKLTICVGQGGDEWCHEF